MFTFLATPMIELIHFFHQFTHNYALSVMFITVIVRVVLLPLFIKASKTQKHSKALMEELKPQMDALNEKMKTLKDDKEKMALQMEMQQLSLAPMKSMMLGCLPILIQLPILISLFYAIKYDTDIASESFLWMNLGTVSIAMAIIAACIYFIQSAITVKKEQPSSVKMMAFLSPVMIFIFSMLNPSIIAIYWATSAVMLIGQQLLIKFRYNS